MNFKTHNMNNNILNKPTDRNKIKITVIKTKGDVAPNATSQKEAKEGNATRQLQPLKIWASPSFFFMY